MNGKPGLIYWDSCIFLSYIAAEVGRVHILDTILEEVQRSNGTKKIITSVLAKTEVAFSSQEKEQKVLLSDVEARIDALWNDISVIGVIEFHDGIAIKARQLMRAAHTNGWSLKPPDAR